MKKESFSEDDFMQQEADRKNAEIVDTKDEAKEKKIKELTEQYRSIIKQYEQALEVSEEVADELLRSANRILTELNAIDPKIKGVEPKSIAEAEAEKELGDLRDKINKDMN